MDWNDIIDGERERLKRIVAWMLAFSLLAERAAMAPPDVRHQVLYILRLGEASVLDYLADLAIEAGYPAEFAEPPLLQQTGSEPADAVRLGLALNALATMIAAILHSVPQYKPTLTHPSCPRIAACFHGVPENQICSHVENSPYARGYIDTS